MTTSSPQAPTEQHNLPKTFSQLPISEAQIQNLRQLGFEKLTPIQAHSLPFILNKQDVLAQAKTGSGKTLAFGLGVIQAINPNFLGIQGLVLCPTRELAMQVADELRKLARALGSIKILLLCGGSAIKPQLESLEFGVQIIVGTPGRVLDLLKHEALELNTVKTFVLDEADRMLLDMGFYDDISRITLACPLRRQTLFFSATYPEPLLKTCEGFMLKPVFVRLENETPNKITQLFYEVEKSERFATCLQLLQEWRPVSTLAFCNTIAQSDQLQDYLVKHGIHSLVLHGQLEQRDRQDVIVQFANKSCSVLVATDVAARGLDIENVDIVLNIDISPNAETHLHRIGRTGRADAAGLALTLVNPEEKYRATRIEKSLGHPLDWQTLKPSSKYKPLLPPMRTICIRGGKKDKLRVTDILGALTKNLGLEAKQVGKIIIYDFVAFVAIDRHIAKKTLDRLLISTIKGRQFKMRFMPEPF